MSHAIARIAAIIGVLHGTLVLSPCAVGQTNDSAAGPDLPPPYYSPTELPPPYLPPGQSGRDTQTDTADDSAVPLIIAYPDVVPGWASPVMPGALPHAAPDWPPAFAPPPMSPAPRPKPNSAVASTPAAGAGPHVNGPFLTGPFLADTPSSTASLPPLAALPAEASTAFGQASAGLPPAQANIYGGGEICPPFSPFSPDPDYSHAPFDPAWEWDVYDGKWFNCTQYPWIELGRGLYRPGPIPVSPEFLGRTNLISQTFLLYGDYRTAVAYRDVNGDEQAVWAHRLNLEFDYKFTATERIHAFWGPLDEDNRFTRFEANDGHFKFFEEFDDDFDTLFFEGDLGYIWGGISDQYAPFDLPFAAGKFPLFFQNGVWISDAVEGFAFTIPARHAHLPPIPNYDVTFFFGFDDIDSTAFGRNDNAANIYGVHGFFDMLDGYFELGYAFLDDTTGLGRSYHNVGMSFTRRYFQRVSNALRVIVNTGQAPNNGGPDTADGTLLMWENALISSNPVYFVPYFNMYAGFGRPQSAARFLDNVLINTGINFETDGLTGYPTLDPTGRNSWGGAVGINWLGPDFRWQWIVELATVQTFGNGAARLAKDDQYAIGTRYQVPLNNAWLVRFDTIHGFLKNDEDFNAARAELRWKF